jgi:WD40 repeat protein
MTATPNSHSPPPLLGSDEPLVSAAEPWPGLASFTEAARDFFFGRDQEAEELFSRIKRETLTILFGRSGLGKTSLLNAGLSSRLRQADMIPVMLRLTHRPDAPPLAEQVRKEIRLLIAAKAIDAPPPEEGETLWAYFHRRDIAFWSPRNRPLTITLIFDQFEEIFTLGWISAQTRARGRAFLEELADLIENRPPASIQERLDKGELDTAQFSFGAAACKVVLSLREDYLAELEGLRSLIRSIQNRMHLAPMNGQQALDVILRGGPTLVDEQVARQIVHFVARQRRGGAAQTEPQDEPLEDMQIEPALLSVFCREHNTTRLDRKLPRITHELLDETGGAILSDFYQRSLEGLPESVRLFVEDRLLTDSGFRNSVALDDALKAGMTQEIIDALLFSRLLHIEDRLGLQRLELSHDILTEPIRQSRERRVYEQKLAAAADRERIEREKLKGARRRLAVAVAGGLLAVGALICLSLSFWAIYQSRLAGVQRINAENAMKLAMQQKALAEANAAEAMSAHAEADRSLAPSLTFEGDAMMLQGNEVEAQNCYDQSLLLFEQLKLPSWPVDFGYWSLAHRREGLRVLIGHTNPVNCVAVSPDGKLAASGSSNQTIKIWNISNGSEIRTLRGRTSPVNGVAFSPEPKSTLATDAAEPRMVNSVAFSPDGKFIASANDDSTIMLWKVNDASSGVVRTFQGHALGVTSVAFLPDGKSILSGSLDSTLKRWDVATGRVLMTYSGQSGAVVAIAVSPDGARALSANGDKTLTLWDLKTGNPIGTMNRGGAVISSCAFLPDGVRAVIGGRDNSIRVWDVNTGRVLMTLKGHTDAVCSVACSPDGHTIASASADSTVRLWDADTGDSTRTLWGHIQQVNAVAFLPSGDVVSGGKDQTVRIWPVTQQGGALRKFPASLSGKAVEAIALSRDGRMALAGGMDTTLKLFDVATGRQLRSFPGHNSRIRSVALSPDGSLALSGDETSQVNVWDLSNGKLLRTFDGHAGTISQVEFSPDGHTALAASYDGTLWIWNTQDLVVSHMLAAHEGGVWSAHFSPDGMSILTGGEDNMMTLWDVATGQQIRQFPPVNSARVGCVGFSADGKMALSGSDDRTLIEWDLQHATPMFTINSTSSVYAAGFSPDQSMIYSVHQDGSLKIWDASTGKQIRSFDRMAGTALWNAVGSATDFRVLTSSSDGTVALWDFSLPAHQRSWNDQITKAQSELVRNPRDARALASKGECEFYNGQCHQAETDLRKSRSMGANPSPLLLAQCEMECEHWSSAAVDMNAAMNLRQAPQPYLQLCLGAIREAEWIARMRAELASADGWSDTDSAAAASHYRKAIQIGKETHPIGSEQIKLLLVSANLGLYASLSDSDPDKKQALQDAGDAADVILNDPGTDFDVLTELANSMRDWDAWSAKRDDWAATAAITRISLGANVQLLFLQDDASQTGYLRAAISLTWSQILTHQPQLARETALQALDKLHDIIPETRLIWLKLNLAHADLLLGDIEKAKDIYYFRDDPTLYFSAFSDQVIKDFKVMRDNGVTSPDMDAIEAQLNAGNPATQSANH